MFGNGADGWHIFLQHGSPELDATLSLLGVSQASRGVALFVLSDPVFLAEVCRRECEESLEVVRDHPFKITRFILRHMPTEHGFSPACDKITHDHVLLILRDLFKR